MRLVALALLLWAAILIWISASNAQTPVSEVNSAALVGPFDQTEGHRTYLTAHAPGGVSPTTGVPAVVVHWTFWSDTCLHLADFETCLTQDDSIVIDVSNMGGVTATNEDLASRFDLTGYRGSWTAHAFEADDRCRDPADAGFKLVDGAINGTWSIADTRTRAAFGDRAQSLNLGPQGFVVVPDGRFLAIDLPFFNPIDLTMSQVILVTVVENFGDFPGEIGPPQGLVQVAGRARICDVQEACLSLPDVVVGCSLFSSLIPGPGALVPETLMPGSSGFLRLTQARFVDQTDPSIVGDMVWVYAWHGQELGPFGTGSRATYSDAIEPSPTPTLVSTTPTPTPEFSPTPTPVLSPVGTPTATAPGETPTPGLSPTPGPTPTGGATATPGASATPNGSPSPSPAGTPTGTPAPSPSPTPSASPTPSPVPT